MVIVMRYEDARRLRGVESAWLRLKLWLGSVHLQRHAPTCEVSHLSDYQKRDIGLHESARYLDGEHVRSLSWGRLKDGGQF